MHQIRIHKLESVWDELRPIELHHASPVDLIGVSIRLELLYTEAEMDPLRRRV